MNEPTTRRALLSSLLLAPVAAAVAVMAGRKPTPKPIVRFIPPGPQGTAEWWRLNEYEVINVVSDGERWHIV